MIRNFLFFAIIWQSFFMSACYLNAKLTDTSSSSNLGSGGGYENGTPVPVPPIVGGPGPEISFVNKSFLNVQSSTGITINLSHIHDEAITLEYETQDLTAVAPENYFAAKGTVTIPAGDLSTTIWINTTDKSDILGTFKDFILKLTSTSAGTIPQPQKILSAGMETISGIVDIVDFNLLGGKRCLVNSAFLTYCWGAGTSNKSPKLNGVLGMTTTQFTMGSGFYCRITMGGGVQCYGSNWEGQLGDGTTTESATEFVNVVGLNSGVLEISSGYGHTCALINDGTVRCWGYNASGQLGDNSTINRSTPVTVSGLSNVSKIKIGGHYSCAVLNDATVKCWGTNLSGQLGDGSAVNRLLPVEVTGLIDVREIYTSFHSTCALLIDGTVKCWGSNSTGQLGDGTLINRAIPVTVTGLSMVSSLDMSSNHTCAVLTNGSIYCWGLNSSAQLGDGSVENRLYPVIAAPSLPAKASKLSLAATSSCALLSTGAVYCWGESSYVGELGDGTISSLVMYPKKVSALGNTVAYSARGEDHTCALSLTGEVKCWGSNFHGQLGDGTKMNRFEPTTISGSLLANQLALGRQHSCALVSSGVKCWGNNSDNQIGDGTTTQRSSPTDVSGLTSGVAEITAGSYHSCALLTDASVKCWGDNASGKLGDGTTLARSTPVSVLGLGPGTTLTVSAGKTSSCAILVGGQIKCWGSNAFGQLGDGTTMGSTSPVTVLNILSGASKISVGEFSACALVNSGIKCWGANFEGELGDGSWNNSSVPVDVFGLTSGMTDITCGGDNSNGYCCAQTLSGGLRCWGNNSYMQLGSGNYNAEELPMTPLVFNADVAKLTSGISANQCVVNENNELFCWGNNEDHQSSSDFSYLPQPVLIGHDDH